VTCAATRSKAPLSALRKEAVKRCYKVIVPMDCSAGEDVYHEQYAAFQLAKGGPVGITSNVTLTRTGVVKF
jgi:hypothetical protein